jgi:hypothetical protein
MSICTNKLVGFFEDINFAIMNKSILINFVIISLIVNSCHNKPSQDTLKQIPVKYTNQDTKVKLSMIVSGTKYIQLETRSDFVVGAIEKAEFIDKIYCMQSNKINVFDKQGKALYEINHYGKKSPEGYIILSTFQVDTINNILEIWDRMSRKIIRFDSNNGSFINSQRFNVIGFFFIKDDEANYYFYSGYGSNPLYMNKSEVYQLLKFNKTGKFLNKFLKEDFNNKKISFISHNILYTYGGNIFLNPPANNFVYILDKDRLSKKYMFDFGKYELKDEFFKEKKNANSLDLDNSNFAWSIGKFREYNFGYSYAYMKDDRLFRGFLSKTTNNNFVSTYLENDFDGGYFLHAQFIQDDLFLTCFEAQVIKEYYLTIKKKFPGKQWDRFKADHSNFCSVCEKLTEMDNPVIVLMTPKEF